MFEQTKVLNGILALDEFTAAELASYTDVKLSTVYTVLKRREGMLEAASESTGRRGGQPLRYRLKPRNILNLRREIDEAAAAVSFERGPSEGEETSSSLDLEAAEEFLTYRMAEAKSAAERRSLLKTADVYLSAAKAEFHKRSAVAVSPLTRERASRLKTLSALYEALDARVAKSDVPDHSVDETEGLASQPLIYPDPVIERTRASLRIGDLAPDFEAATTQGILRFHDWIGDSWVVFFSHFHDTSPVSFTELSYMAKLKGEFDRRNTKIIGLSNDSLDEHQKWDAEIRAIHGHGLDYPLISDTDLSISRLYGMLSADTSTYSDKRATSGPAILRTLLIIAPEKKIRLVLVYPSSTGRNFDEVLRVIDSLQLTAKHRVSTPANWKQGEDVIIAGSLSDDEARAIFPQGWKVELPMAARLDFEAQTRRHPAGIENSTWSPVRALPSSREALPIKLLLTHRASLRNPESRS
jgi:thioredoxin-dependent peroxiredoxin